MAPVGGGPRRVFLSHTSELRAYPPDRSYVTAAESAVIRAGHALTDMAYFAAQDSAPADICARLIANADIYVGIIGLRYGTLVPGRSDVSYTELEFDEATARGLPRLIFLIRDHGARLPTGHDARQQAFRQRLREGAVTVAWVDSASDLELALYQALIELRSGHEATAIATKTLPRDVAAFTGRDQEQDRVLAIATEPSAGNAVAISTIDGMAGVGKTAFAVHVAHRMAHRFPDGQLYLDLHAHTAGRRPVTPFDALGTLLMATGVSAQSIPTDLDGRSALWRDRLAHRRVLILLDDATGHEQVRPLLPGTSGCMVLITSRRRLTALQDVESLTLSTLPPAQAATLFTRLIGCGAGDADVAAVAELMELCGYLPLAIGLLAGRLRDHASWTVRYLTDVLRESQDRLEEMQAENIAVAAAFGLSYEDLSADQRRLFRRLSLHPGPDVDAWAAAALDGSDVAQTRRALETLYDHNLVEEPLPGRYRFHALIHAYARSPASRIDEADDDVAIDRLLDYYLFVCAATNRHIPHRGDSVAPSITYTPVGVPTVDDREKAMAWLQAERANLAACIDHAVMHARPTHAVQLAASMHDFLRAAGHWDQAVGVHRLAVVAAGNTGDRLHQADALHRLGVMQRLTSQHTAAIASLTHALATYQELGHRLGQANTLIQLGVVQRHTNAYPSATSSFASALAVHRDLGHRLGQATALAELAIMRSMAGESDAAIDCLIEALTYYRDLDNRLGQAHVLNDLGWERLIAGEYSTAATLLKESLALFRELGDQFGQVHALHELAVAQLMTCDYDGAAASLTESLGLSRLLSYRHGEVDAWKELGAMQRLTGHYEAARVSLTEALAIAATLADQLSRAHVLREFGGLCHSMGEYQMADAHLREALDVFYRLGHKLGRVETLNNLGMLLHDMADPGSAVVRHQEALRLARDIGAPLEEARALEGIGRCLVTLGEDESGAASMQAAWDIYKRMGLMSPDSWSCGPRLSRTG
jgi:tetratricopeptide (TPR) repeat protein